MRGSGIVALGCGLLVLGCASQQPTPQPAFDPSTDPRPETLERDLQECLVVAQELTGYRGPPAALSSRTRQRATVQLREKEAFDQAYSACMLERGHQVVEPSPVPPSAPE